MPKRIRLSRAKGWRLPENAVNVARPGRWGNPYRVTHDQHNGWCVITDIELVRWYCDSENKAKNIAVRAFEKYIALPLTQHRLSLDDLRGKDLACWCKLETPCHADILLELANQHPEGHMPKCSSNLCATCGLPDGAHIHHPFGPDKERDHEFQPGKGDCELCRLRAENSDLKAENERLKEAINRVNWLILHQ